MSVAIVGIVFLFAFLVVKMGIDYSKAKLAAGDSDSGSSMRVSELEQMINSAVSDAVEPLISRLDDLESEKLLATSEKLLLDEGEVAEKEKVMASSGRKLQQQ